MTTLSQKLSDRKTQVQLLRILTHAGAIIPLLLLYYDYYTYNLGFDEIRTVLLRTGKLSLIFLFLSLACTPLNTIFGWSQFIAVRRPLGLYAFLYVCLHFFTFAVIDYGADLAIVWEEIVMRRYALAGFAAFLILTPLAITSTKTMQRRLGKQWRKLHRWVYVAAVLAVIHYIWLVKNFYTEPLTYAAILLLLFIVRFSAVKKQLGSWRRSLLAKWRTRSTQSPSSVRN